MGFTFVRIACIAALFALLVPGAIARQRRPEPEILNGLWETDTSRKSIDLRELFTEGMPKDGVPVVARPRFASIDDAKTWLAPNEPVVALDVNGVRRAYPLEILLWHEIVQDDVGGVPVVVTFCALTHTAIVFDRRLGARTLTFGISGMLRGANMVLYDHETESWWQQFVGEAVVGALTGSRLHRVPVQIVGIAQFAAAYPEGAVLSRETGFERAYGTTPHVHFDAETNDPPASLLLGPPDRRVPPLERVVGVAANGVARVYPYSLTRARRVVEDRLGATPIVIFHADGALSAMDERDIRTSRDVGATGVFDPRAGGRTLHFRYDGGRFVDAACRSTSRPRRPRRPVRLRLVRLRPEERAIQCRERVGQCHRSVSAGSGSDRVDRRPIGRGRSVRYDRLVCVGSHGRGLSACGRPGRSRSRH